MKRSTASTKKSGWRGYGDSAEGQDSSSSASSSEYGSPAAKSPREESAAFDQSQANFDFSGLDQTFAGLNQTSTHDLTEGAGLDMPKRGSKGNTPQKPHLAASTASVITTAVTVAMSQSTAPTSTVVSGASSSSVPPASNQGAGSSTISSSGNSVTFAATASTAQVVTTEGTPATSTASHANDFNTVEASIPARLNQIRDLRTACNTSITSAYDWITKVQKEMTALISCEATNRRLSEFLLTLATIEAGMEYNTQVYSNAVRPVCLFVCLFTRGPQGPRG
jgi:hypothetical protein